MRSFGELGITKLNLENQLATMKMYRFLFDDGGNGPIRSNKKTCQGHLISFPDSYDPVVEAEEPFWLDKLHNV